MTTYDGWKTTEPDRYEREDDDDQVEEEEEQLLPPEMGLGQSNYPATTARDPADEPPADDEGPPF